MEEQHTADEQSHYEISLTAGQAFVAFVLLLLSLAASFAFGLMLGKGQADERLVVRKDNPVVTEASLVPRTNTGEIIDVAANEYSDQVIETADSANAEAEAGAPKVVEEAAARVSEPAAETATVTPEPSSSTPPQPVPVRMAETKPEPVSPAAAKPAAALRTERVPHFAQLLSTGDQKAAESLAVKLINRGFTTAYVERGTNEKGPVFRVRVGFASEQDARAAEPKLREFAKEVWITAK